MGHRRVISLTLRVSEKSPLEPLAGTWPCGRFRAEWDDQASVIREGQLIFFFQFLQAGGRWEDFLCKFPLHYTGNCGSGADYIIGTVLCSVNSTATGAAPISMVDRQVRSGGQRTVKVSILHKKGDVIAKAVAEISKELHEIHAITERRTVDQRWALLLTRLLRHGLDGKWLPGLPIEAKLLLSG